MEEIGQAEADGGSRGDFSDSPGRPPLRNGGHQSTIPPTSRRQEGSVDARLRTALDLVDRLCDPRLQKLAALAERSESLAHMAELLDHVPAAFALLTDTADETYYRAQAAGIDVEERLRNSLALLDKLTDGPTAEALLRLGDRVDRFEALFGLVDEVPSAAAAFIDALDELARELEGDGIDPALAVRRLGNVARSLARAARVSAEPKVPSTSVPSLWELWKSLRDVGVRRALGATLSFASAFGHELRRVEPSDSAS